MLFNTLAASSLFVASALAVAEPKPYMLAKMSLNNMFGLVGRQAAGYSPTQTYCGPGTDCPSSCGADFVQCASTDGDLHCYDPSVQQTCCPDGTGNSCDEGYYCTTQSTGGTWCCPNGLSLTDCAAAYSLTGVLVSEASTAAPSTAPSSSAPSSVAVTPTTSPTSTASVAAVTSSTSSTGSSAPVVQVNPSGSGASKTTASSAVQVTAGANVQAVIGALPALAFGVAGAVLAL